jgi:hypothetical protein
VPTPIPVTSPVTGSAEATLSSLLLHDPPLVELVSVFMPPIHIVVDPDIDDGIAFTVSVAVTIQTPTVYMMVVVPAATL